MNNFTKISKLGEGVFGQVWKMHDARLQTFAVKTVEFPLKAEIEYFDSLPYLSIVEAVMLNSIDSEYVLRAEKTFIEGSTFHHVTEVMDGNLHGIINSKTEYEPMVIIKDIVRGLMALHSRGIIHTDLKPENIFHKNKRFLIGDIDGRIATHEEKPKGFTSLWWRAPELLPLGDRVRSGIAEETEGFVTPAIDVWSLGCIIVEIITGKPLFSRLGDKPIRDTAQMARRIRQYSIGFDRHGEEIDKFTVEMLKGILTLNPHKRWTIFQVADYLDMKEEVIPRVIPTSFRAEFLPRKNALFDWVYRIGKEFGFPDEVFLLFADIHDLYADHTRPQEMTKTKYQHIGAACFLLASKMMYCYFDLSKLLSISNDALSIDEIVAIERKIAVSLEFKLYRSGSFLSRFGESGLIESLTGKK